MRPYRLARDQKPATEIAGLDASRPVPGDLDGPQKPEPSQQVQAVGAGRRLRPACCLQIPQIGGDRFHRNPEALHDALHGPPPPGRDEQVRNEVLDRVRLQPGLAADDLDYLDRRLAPPDGYKLAHRLGALVKDDLGADLRTLITKRTDPLPDFLVLEETDGRQTIWETVATARNRIAHGKTPVPSVEQVKALMKLAHTLATALALG